MARLTAVFDMIDRVSSKAKGIVRALGDVEKASQKASRGVDALGSKKATSTIDINDRATPRMQRIQNNLQRVANKAYTITVDVNDKATATLEKLRTVATSTPVTMTVAVGAATSGAAIGGSVKKAMDFEAQMSTIKALTGATSQEMREMKTLSMEMGATTKYSSLEAARGIEELLKGGMTPAMVKAGGLEAALNTATAGGMELAEAATLMSNSLNGFKKDALSAAETSNILAGAANASAADLIDLKYGLASVGPVASGVGISFRDTNAALALFSNNNMGGSDAGTSLKTFLLNLAPSTEENTKLFDKMGITTKGMANEFFTAAGKAKGLDQIAAVLQKRFGHLNDQQRQAKFKDMFGTDAIRAANILYEEGAEGVQKMYKEIGKVTALDVAKEKMNNAKGALEQLSGAMETIAISAATPLMPFIKESAEGFADFMNKMEPQIKTFGEGVARTLEDAFSPFQKPEISKALLDEMKINPELRKEVQLKMDLYEMPFDEKVNHAMNKVTDKMKAWLDGPGGAKVQVVFERMIEIGFKAWENTLTKLMETSWNNLKEGNYATAGGATMLAYLLGGGLLLKGGTALVKNGYGLGKKTVEAGKKVVEVGGKVKDKVLKRKPAAETPGHRKIDASAKTDPYGTKQGTVTRAEAPKSQPKPTTKAAPEPAPKPTRTAGALATGGGLLGALGTYFTLTSAGDLGAATGDWVFGHKEGGYKNASITGEIERWKDARDPIWIRMWQSEPKQPPAASPQPNTPQVPAQSSSAINESSKLAAQNLKALAITAGTAAGQIAGAISPVQASSKLAGTNIGALAIIVGISAGNIAGAVSGIQTAAQGVSDALQNLAARIAAVRAPEVGGGIVSVPAPVHGSHAKGISNIPFDGYIAETHKGETILPPEEAEILRSLGSDRKYSKGNSVSIENLIGKVIIQNEADEDRLVIKLMQALQEVSRGNDFNSGLYVQP